MHWSGEDDQEIASALVDLGLKESGDGRYVAEGEGRKLIRVVGAIRQLEGRVRAGGSDEIFTVHFEDAGTLPSEPSRG